MIFNKIINDKNNLLRKDYSNELKEYYYQYKFKVNKENNLYFKFFPKSNFISEIYISDKEYLGIYKLDFINVLLDKTNKNINSKNYLVV